MREDHRLEGVYIAGNCRVQIEGGEPFILMNLEMLSEIKNLNSPHCDFFYLLCKNDEYHLFLIELKSIEKINQQGFKKLLDNVYNKFITSRKILDLLFQIISTNSKKQINIQKMQIHDILVIPDAYKISALLKKFGKKIKPISCGNNIWSY